MDFRKREKKEVAKMSKIHCSFSNPISVFVHYTPLSFSLDLHRILHFHSAVFFCYYILLYDQFCAHYDEHRYKTIWFFRAYFIIISPIKPLLPLSPLLWGFPFYILYFCRILLINSQSYYNFSS